MARPFGPYNLLERIGVGGTAEVFEAVQRDGGSRVAIKRILTDAAADEEFISLFHDECAIAGQLEHPHIARIYDVGEVEGGHYMAMEFVEGKPLRTLIDRAARHGRRLPIDVALYIICCVASGLDYAHRRGDSQGRPLGIVHRDVTPRNILVSYAGDIKLIDFGVAKAKGKLNRTQAGNIKGSLGYMAPEQVFGRGVDGRADVFSLGICLWECLTGQRLFEAENELVMLQQIRSQEIVAPSASQPGLPRELDGIVLKALAKDPQQRYATAANFAADLQTFARRHQQTADATTVQGFMAQLFGANVPGSDQRPVYQQENRMSDKGGSDLDVFDGLGKQRPAQAPAQKPNPVRQKTLLGLPAPNVPPPGAGAPPPSRGPAPPPSRRPGPPSGGAGLPPPPVPSGRSSGSLPPKPPPPSTAAPVDMDWDDEDEKTAIYDKQGTEDAARALLGSAPPPPAAGAPPPPPASGQASAAGALIGGAASAPPPAPTPGPMAAPAQAPAPAPAPPTPRVEQAPVMPQQQPSSGGRSALFAILALLLVGVVAAAFVLLRAPGAGTLTVTVAGPGNRAVDAVQVFVDGKKKCDTSPCRLKDIEAGTHMVKVVAAGYQETAEQAVKVSGGEDAVLRVDLAPASGGTGVKVTAEGSGLKLYVDGKEIGPLPQELKDMTPGEHTIKVAGNDRYEPWEKKVVVKQDKLESFGPLKLKVKKGLAYIKRGENADGAQVYLVSGKTRRRLTKLPIKVDIKDDKEYSLEATRRGYTPYKEDITFEDGNAEKTFEIKLYEIGKDPPKAPATGPKVGSGGGKQPADKPKEEDKGGSGTLNINSIPVSNVILDGRPLGQTPRVGISVPPGSHTVVFVHPEHGRKVRSANVKAGKSVTVAVRFP